MHLRQALARLRRPTALLALAGTGLVAGLAPYAERGGSTVARDHVEAAGTSVHYAHAEDMCAACGALHLLAQLPAASHLAEQPPIKSRTGDTRRVSHLHPALFPRTARAPPPFPLA